jgi:nickel-dependent lactate racemase
MKVNLPELLWYGNGTVELDLPDDWEVEICPMRGAERPELSDEEIVDAIQKPIGSGRIRELARGRRKAVVLFDDMTRPTPVYRIAPMVVSELIEGGIEEENISFVCALGTHGALSSDPRTLSRLQPQLLRELRRSGNDESGNAAVGQP